MKKLEVINIENYEYQLKDKENIIYNIILEFHDVEIPKIGDYIYINERLLNKKSSNFYAFGPLDGIYGKNIKNNEDEDIIILDTKKKKILLKRYYG